MSSFKGQKYNIRGLKTGKVYIIPGTKRRFRYVPIKHVENAVYITDYYAIQEHQSEYNLISKRVEYDFYTLDRYSTMKECKDAFWDLIQKHDLVAEA